jgi:Ser/Thr protein kinase RdoA (MazF antagonist)
MRMKSSPRSKTTVPARSAAGCLVHKDLALWNILGTEREIAAFIDFDDSDCR